MAPKMAAQKPSDSPFDWGFWDSAACIVVFLLAKFWLDQVTQYVPDPYLDEVFHIPQAQVYCSGDYKTWDDKITTPPGLYAFSNILLKLMNLVQGVACSTYELRATNFIALILLVSFATACRRTIESIPSNVASITFKKSWTFTLIPLSPYAIHTAFNIGLFPPLFFFSGLYYTDILSTATVLLTYSVFLCRQGAYTNSSSDGWLIFVYGILSLTMRQTNIFWVGVFMAGLELVRTFKSFGPFPTRTYRGDMHPYKYLQLEIEAYSRGEIHDVSLENATLYDCALCLISIAIAAVCNPVFVVTRLWPYLALLSSFTGFVIWNGGVVLGDKSNHIATIHLPQMLYIWPFFAFFSAPLLFPYALNVLKSLFSLLFTRSTAQTPTPHPREIRKRQLETALKRQRNITSFFTFTALLLVVLAIIHYNTIIHPFTLADNRHYVFYVFRYSILRHPAIKYLLAPVYLICGYLVIQCLSGSQTTTPLNSPEKPSPPITSPLFSTGNDLSFTLILLISTTLSLVTAPLVEPRYFIVPWVIWRLHVPTLTTFFVRKSKKELIWSYDLRLLFETVWFLGINFVVGWVFLFKGFEWIQEPGRVQRFMW